MKSYRTKYYELLSQYNVAVKLLEYTLEQLRLFPPDFIFKFEEAEAALRKNEDKHDEKNNDLK